MDYLAEVLKWVAIVSSALGVLWVLHRARPTRVWPEARRTKARRRRGIGIGLPSRFL